MLISIQTIVQQDIHHVWQGFTRELFLALAPPFTPINLLRFDGCKKGDEVHLEIDLLLSSQLWCSRITEQKETEDEIYFIDEGTKLPFFLTYWKHKHRIIRHKQGSVIADEIEFHSILFSEPIIYPALYAQFLYRQPIYQKWFSE